MKIVYLFIVVLLALAMTFQTVVAWNNKNFKIRSCSLHSDCETIAKKQGAKAKYLVSYCVVDEKKMAAVYSCFFTNFLAMSMSLITFMSWIYKKNQIIGTIKQN